MPANTNPNAYPEARRFLDTALDHANGVAIEFATRGEATKFRQRCYQVRSNVRRYNQRVYDPDSAMYASSPWDTITLELREPTEDKPKWAVIAWGDETELRMFDPVTGEEITP
jgi:hypothetical protein